MKQTSHYVAIVVLFLICSVFGVSFYNYSLYRSGRITNPVPSSFRAISGDSPTPEKQRTNLVVALNLFDQGVISPPKSGYELIEDDLWGTPIRMLYIEGVPAFHSAGPNRIFDDDDDVLVSAAK